MGRRIAALIRHGDYQQRDNTPSALQPFPLYDSGALEVRKQAIALQALVCEKGWQLLNEIDCSSLLRAWQTAVIFAEKNFLKQDSKVSTFDCLCERSVGSVANLSVEEIEHILALDPRYESPPTQWKSNSHYKLPFPGAESLLEAGLRVADHIQMRMQAVDDSAQAQVKLFVGHGAAFRHAAYHLGVFTLEQVKQYSMYHAQPVFLELLPNGRWVHILGNWKVRQSRSEYTD